MNKKPDCKTAMLNIIQRVRDDFPFYAPESQICGDTCVGCPFEFIFATKFKLQRSTAPSTKRCVAYDKGGK